MRNNGTRLVVLSLALAMLGCTPLRDSPSTTEPFSAREHPGVWVSSGYGLVMVSTADTVRLYHHAGNVCVEQPSDELSLLDFLELVRTSEEDDVLVLSSELDPFEYTFRRVRALPASCLAPVVNTPTGNFDALAAYFGEHYAFFDLYGVDWDARVAQARRTITDSMSDRKLFDAMSELLRPLRDSHIQIDASIDGGDAVYDGNPGKTDAAVVAWGARAGLDANDAVASFRRAFWIDDIQDTLLKGEGVVTANGRMQFGVLDGNVGYIAFVSMGGFVDGEFETAYEERPVLHAAMDEALTLFAERGVEAVIIDLSLNIGGYDFVGLDIASHFATERTAAFTRRAGDDANATDFTLFLEPSSGRRFSGATYVLTSDLTVSAAEILTLGLRALDNVTHIGERTRGSFSTVLTKYLPNGWEISLSNEIYTDPQGEVWEGRGIAPQVDLQVFDPDNPLRGHVQAVQAAAHRARDAPRR